MGTNADATEGIRASRSFLDCCDERFSEAITSFKRRRCNMPLRRSLLCGLIVAVLPACLSVALVSNAARARTEPDDPAGERSVVATIRVQADF
jgi:hypothetical protein